eukprot:CAMPEP_0180282702 /NCGR_PEP_ID=MMETSP0988-20121125/9986_1 /TAXON_ID=697907 /ORGANISM="non described non described, Strain CCMP2293" /LENGTH=41 /DNA_ID= /DNA_START= /DNA_END= /DNA_ORIENTATION=
MRRAGGEQEKMRQDQHLIKRDAASEDSSKVQGYLAHKKPPP